MVTSASQLDRTKGKKRTASNWTWVSWLKIVVFVLCLAPAALIVHAILTGAAGPNPIEYITHSTGQWALRFLLLGLVLSPLRWWFKSLTPIKFRRMIGLFAFFYVVTHFATYAVLDQQLNLAAVAEDLLKRTYIVAGFASLCLLVPLALTSTKAMQRRLGRRWLSLHRLVYVACIAAVLHYVWLAKGDQIEPMVYAGILIFLLALRLFRRFKSMGKKNGV